MGAENMRRIKIIILSAFLLVSLVGCGKSEAAVAVDEKIKAIGTVSLDSEASITDAEQAYNALSEGEKKQVEGYDTLTKAKDDYKKAVEEYEKQLEEEYKSKIEESYNKIKDLDMKGAYEIAVNLPDEYSEDRDKIIQKVDNSCYEKTFFAKLENVTSSLPKSTSKPDRAISGGITYGHQYADFNSMQTALSDYYNYLNTYYISTDNTGLSYDQYSMSAQTYEFENENGHKITVSGSDLFGMYFFNINIEENVDYRDVVKTNEE